MFLIYFLCCLVVVRGAAVKESLKDEHCTDPRTMRKHAAYTEWADAYSCTRHRCQPGGRNLAIYTVGCKRVEAPESAIECEEVVEDTNMQFPYCCTRLRCLVVVRGEVWTRVLGQPWETLPAAPWSHMYKMKKPPPVDTTFLPKNGPAAGPVYELADEKREPADRRNNEKDCDKPVVRAQAPAAPDIVIALTTNSEKKSNEPEIPSSSKFLSQGVEEQNDRPNDIEAEETLPATEKSSTTFRPRSLPSGLLKVPEIVSEERMFNTAKKTARDRKIKLSDMISEDEQPQPTYRGLKDSRLRKGPDATSNEQYNANVRLTKQKMNDAVSEEGAYSNAEKKSTRGPKSWARIPQEHWNSNPSPRTQLLSENANDYKDRESAPKVEPPLPVFHGDSEEKQEDKPASLQHLVNAIGTRMRDIENVVQQMSEKVQPPAESAERMRDTSRSMVHPKEKPETEPMKPKKPYPDNYNRFPPQQGASKYIHGGADATTEPPLFVGDNLNGYFSDPSNNLLRRAMKPSGPKEPSETYMVPINTDHKKPTASDSDEPEIKHKKHTHKKKKSKHGKKKHRREEREKKKFTKTPAEFEKNVVSLEDSNDFGTETMEPIRAAPERSWFDIRQQPSASYRPIDYRPTNRRPKVPYRPMASYRPIDYRPTNRRPKVPYRPMARYRPKATYPQLTRYRPIATGRRRRLSHKQLVFLHNHAPLIKRIRNLRKYRHRI